MFFQGCHFELLDLHSNALLFLSALEADDPVVNFKQLLIAPIQVNLFNKYFLFPLLNFDSLLLIQLEGLLLITAVGQSLCLNMLLKQLKILF